MVYTKTKKGSAKSSEAMLQALNQWSQMNNNYEQSAFVNDSAGKGKSYFGGQDNNYAAIPGMYSKPVQHADNGGYVGERVQAEKYKGQEEMITTPKGQTYKTQAPDHTVVCQRT